MTVSTLTSSNAYQANGVTTVFPYTFRILVLSDLKVSTFDSDGVETPVVSGFTVSGVGYESGGNVTFTTPPESGLSVLVYRDVPLVQPTDYKNQGPFYGRTHEFSFDRATMQIQQQSAASARALRVSKLDGPITDLPPAANRSGKLMAFDDVGNPTTAFPVADSSTELRMDLAAQTGSGILGWLQSGTGAVLRWVQAKLRDMPPCPLDFGAVGNGVTNDTAAINKCITECNARGVPMSLVGRTFAAAGTITMPTRGICGGGSITGATIKFAFSQVTKVEGKFVFGAVQIDSLFFASFHSRIECTSLLVYSSDNTWGTFWNNFGDWQIEGEMTIDCDRGQSINQNNWGNVRATGGMRIKGVNGSGIRECHGNVFTLLDTTGANMTAADGTTGWHILNESNLNQTNTILGRYAEATGTQGIRGNFNIGIGGSNVDSNYGHTAITDRNHSLGSTTHVDRSNGDFLAASAINDAIGGEWDVLTGVGEDAFPWCLVPFGTTAPSTPFGAASSPTGINRERAIETSTTFSGFQINFQYPSARTVSVVLVYQGSDFVTIESDGGASAGVVTWTHPSGWKIARFTIPDVTSSIKLFMNGGAASYKRTSINAVRAAHGKTVMFPSFNPARGEIAGKALSVAISATTAIAIPNLDILPGVNGMIAGRINIKVIGRANGPNFVGVVGIYSALFVRHQYGGVHQSTVLADAQNAVDGINTSGTPTVTVSGTTAGVDVVIGGVAADDVDLYWRIDLIPSI